MTVTLEIIKSASGLSVYLGNTRIAGPKPTVGATQVGSWTVDQERVVAAVKAE